jgi:hypothetical protein
MEQSRELDVPMDGTIRKLHVVRYGRPFIVGNGMQNRKIIFESSISTPNVLPKTNPRALAGVKAAVTPKNLPTRTYIFPETHSMRASDNP